MIDFYYWTTPNGHEVKLACLVIAKGYCHWAFKGDRRL
jgi:hypothetical protein